VVRQIRDELRKEIQHEEEDGKISENQKFSETKKLETMTEETNTKIAEIASKKEKEILTI
jgi:ribosome recycling factor